VSCKTDSENNQSLQSYKDKAFTEFFRCKSGWTAGDGALSVPLTDGRVLWLFGDSHINDYDPVTGTLPCLFQVRNAAMLHDKDDLQHPRTLLGTQPGDKSFFKHPTNDKLWFWPSAGFQNEDTVYVYLTALRQAGAGTFGFKSVGHYFARIKFPEMEVAGYVALPDFNGIDFGCGFVEDKLNDYTYAFGSKGVHLGNHLYVARFQTTNPGTNWTYWDGKDWTPNVVQAAIIANAASTSMSVCKVKGKYLLTSSAFSIRCDMGKEIYISTSDSPTGPFSTRQKIFTLDDTVRGHYPFFYLPVAHPEFINYKNELLVTYSINGYEPCLKSCVKGRTKPDHYRPKAIRVPLQLIN